MVVLRRVSSLLRDWLDTNLAVGHFFSFRCSLVNTPQLNTQLLTTVWRIISVFYEEWITTLLSLPGDPNIGHYLEQLVVILPLWQESVFGDLISSNRGPLLTA
jgi:hypothetical protein